MGLVVLSDLSFGLNCGSAGPAFRAAGKEGRHQCSADDGLIRIRTSAGWIGVVNKSCCRGQGRNEKPARWVHRAGLFQGSTTAL
jgi:hypothetical protein